MTDHQLASPAAMIDGERCVGGRVEVAKIGGAALGVDPNNADPQDDMLGLLRIHPNAMVNGDFLHPQYDFVTAGGDRDKIHSSYRNQLQLELIRAFSNPQLEYLQQPPPPQPESPISQINNSAVIELPSVDSPVNAGENDVQRARSASSAPKEQKKGTAWQSCGSRKRPRATYEQLSVLERAFQVNSLPSAKVREALSRQLHMRPRSIHIWFQNRRAKEKLSKRRAEEKLAGSGAVLDRQPQHSHVMDTGCLNHIDGPAQQAQHLRGECDPSFRPYGFQYMRTCVPSPLQGAAHYSPCCAQIVHPPPLRACAPISPTGNISKLPPSRASPRISVPLDLLMIGSWHVSSSENREIFLTFDTANRTLELSILSREYLRRIVSQVTSVSSIHLTRVHPNSAQITIKLSSPPGIYGYPKNPGYVQGWDSSSGLGELAPGDTLEQIMYGDSPTMRASLLEFAKRDSHIRGITFMKIESPEARGLVNPPGLAPQTCQIGNPPPLIGGTRAQQPWDCHPSARDAMIDPFSELLHSTDPRVIQQDAPLMTTVNSPVSLHSSQSEKRNPPEGYNTSSAQFQSLKPRTQNVLVK